MEKKRRNRKPTADFTGQRFGKLVIIERLEKNGKRNSYYFKCKCDCGNECKVLRVDMVNGNTKSCGCMSSRNIAGDRTRTHGMRMTRQYNIWSKLKARCDNPNTKSYKDYGAKGITYCEKWKSFEGFWEDMQEGYEDDLTIDRIDYTKNYCNENCRWITKAMQAQNKSDNVIVEYNGEKLPLKTMCNKLNLPYRTIRYRIKSGWSVNDAFEKPIKGHK